MLWHVVHPPRRNFRGVKYGVGLTRLLVNLSTRKRFVFQKSLSVGVFLYMASPVGLSMYLAVFCLAGSAVASTPLSHRPACWCEECKVVDPEGGHGTAQLLDVGSAKEGRVECLEVSIGEADSPPTTFYAFVGQGRLKLDIEADALKDHSGGLLNPSICVLNNPIPSNLKSEAKKAAKILREFTEITSRNGPDKIIPPHVIAKAKGLAVLSVIKAGFLVTARGGSGIVLARLPNGTWSAPSAIGIAGLGGGFEIGIEVSDLVIILNHERAVEAFAKGGNLTLGGNLTVAIGPLGRNLEGDVALRSSAAVYTYCKSRGLFAGVSLEGTCLIERKETNRKFYGQDIRASAILLGDVPFPAQAEDLYEILASFTEVYENEEQKNNPGKAVNDPPAQPSLRPEPPKPTVRPTPPAKKNTNKLYPELPNDYASVGNQLEKLTESSKTALHYHLIDMKKKADATSLCPSPYA
ncbi:PREDICTED: SH3 domain-containing YSC84-like protein 1, partial [Nestor notabilis]|uniref:SH3 domain-containing YSC84-like protein 1 n=1 Tax=Nestor notabilis TaxID=176057 RepID=UPI000523AEEA